MPLHLLGKKSWNVYNNDNIERVRRDEVQARVREEAEEERMQEEDAQRRIALLRGESVPALPAPSQEHRELEAKEPWRDHRADDTYVQRDRKRRRLRGEDDTDRDIRHARKDTNTSSRPTKVLLREREKDAPLQDHAGNIQLFPAPDEVTLRKTEKNAEAEAEKAKKRKREEDQYTMRFRNAAGIQSGMRNPWYASVKDHGHVLKAAPSTDPVPLEVQGKEVWGDKDPLCRERARKKISSNDPFAAMQTAQSQLKQSQRDKVAWEERQRMETEEFKRQQRRHPPREHHDDSDSLDGFSLDPSAPERHSREPSDLGRHGKHRHRQHHSHRRKHESRHRNKSRSQERGNHRVSHDRRETR